MSLSHLCDSSIRPSPPARPTTPKRRRPRIALALLLLTLLTGQASLAVEVRQGTCPAPRQSFDDGPTPGAKSGPCYIAELPSAGWWYIEVTVRVDSPTRRWPKRPHLLEARFELLLAIDHAGTYRVCPSGLPPGATVEPFSAFMPLATKEGDPDEIELEPDLLTVEPIVVALMPCDLPSKEGDPDEIELEPDL